MNNYNIIMSTNDSTVAAVYEPVKRRSTSYQTEAELEKAFADQLVEQGYEALNIKSEKDLIDNLRKQLEKLNRYEFTDSEWKRFFNEKIANPNEGIVEKTEKIQKDHIQVLERDNGETKNIILIDKNHIHNNSLQVIRQYVEDGGANKVRYDVTILINGLPLVHNELKRRGIPVEEAFNQINRYQRDGFWASSGLFEYVQIFVISNGTYTKYYSNTTRSECVKNATHANKTKKSSKSFRFTSYWADSKNNNIYDLVDFTKTFFAKHTLLNVLTKYCVFAADKQLLVMRPYQIAAVEGCESRIEIANNHKLLGTTDACGFIWHTTGSGKTLTSFKLAQLAAERDDVDKVLFVVDRKDLDSQTMREYDRYEKGAANSNADTKTLKRQLEDKNEKGGYEEHRIIVTTIQKLDNFVKNNARHPSYDKRVVIIFDECHRSQFGSMHTRITKAFKNYCIFGFTGTPIFGVNSNTSGTALKTTEQVFGKMLHSYTIVNAINDENVLPFNVDVVNTFKTGDDIKDDQVSSIDTDGVIGEFIRVKNNVRYMFEHFDQKTKNRKYNSIFATESISMAMRYYKEIKEKNARVDRPLSVAVIYSSQSAQNQCEEFLDDETFDVESLNENAKDFLASAMKDYNERFGTSFGISQKDFDSYYEDISIRMRNKELDVLVVVDMFLTGFDCPLLNTLWVDKPLKYHGLLQAFSRTNRITNAIKSHGNIVCFRNLKQEIDDAVALFGDKNAKGVVLLKEFDSYYNGYVENGKKFQGYASIVNELREKFPIGKELITNADKREFITLFGRFLRLKNILASFDEFEGAEILSERDIQDYQGVYVELRDRIISGPYDDKEDITNDVVFETELMKHFEIDIDYILHLVEKLHDTNNEPAEVIDDIRRGVGSSSQLRSKKDLIEEFVRNFNIAATVESEWVAFTKEKREAELLEIIREENLKEEECKRLIRNAFRDGELKVIGMGIDEILPPISLFGTENRAKKNERVTERLLEYFEKYSNI